MSRIIGAFTARHKTHARRHSSHNSTSSSRRIGASAGAGTYLTTRQSLPSSVRPP